MRSGALPYRLEDDGILEGLDRLGNSPDLSLFQKLWSIMKDGHTITSLKKLQDTLIKMWVQLPKDLMKKLVHSMPRRLKICMDDKGQMTKH
jgi:hypothetical protein